MTDNLTKSQRLKNMRNIRSSGTKPERIVMAELRNRGIYFARNVSALDGKPDIVFRRKKIVVFIDSDFWHGKPGGFIMPKSNRKYWQNKIAGNRARDIQVNRRLKKQGWKVIRLWESQIKKNLDRCINKIFGELEKKEIIIKAE